MTDLLGHGRAEIAADGVRFVLSERWGRGPMLGCIGMNPSHAGEDRTDMTWLRWRGFAVRWGFGGQIALNPNPARSPSPQDGLDWLARARDGDEICQAHLARNGLLAVEHAQEPVLWLCAWGDGGARMNAVVPVVDDLLYSLRLGGAATFIAFGLTLSGNPIHVSARGKARLKDDAIPYRFDPDTRVLGDSWRAPSEGSPR